MPIYPSEPGFRDEGSEGNSPLHSSISQLSSDLQSQHGCNTHQQESSILEAPFEDTWKTVHHTLGECRLGSQVSQQLQSSVKMASTVEVERMLSEISGIPDVSVYHTPTLLDTPDSMITSGPSSEPNSEICEVGALNLNLDMGFGVWDPFDINPGIPISPDLPYSGFSCPEGWEGSEMLFLDNSEHSLDQPHRLKHDPQTWALNTYNKEGGSHESPPFTHSRSDQTAGIESGRLDAENVKSLSGEDTGGTSIKSSTPWSADESTATSDYEDDITYDTSDDILKPLVESLLKKLLSTYSSYTPSRKRTEGETEKQCNTGVPGSVLSDPTGKQTVANDQCSRGSNTTKRKRQEISQNSDGEDGDEGELPPKKRVIPPKEDALLACPFAKWKPLSYQSCYKYIMKDIRRVKQHLRRNHKRPLHCPTCWDTFKLEEAFYSHIKDRTCLPQPERAIEGMTASQQEHLEGKVDRKLSKSDQWYSIFSTLFQDSPRPKSAYLESDLSAELLDFQRFMASDGLEIVEQTVHEQIPATLIPQAEEIMAFSQALFQQAIPEILKKYETTRPHNSSPDSGYGSICLSSSGLSILDEHSVNEGTRLGPVCETIQKSVSLEDHSAIFGPSDLLIPNNNIPNSQELMTEIDDFLGMNMSWDEGAMLDIL
ncbi:hypothetical protein F5Y08DRAFT_298594 [Xylaria arbuscula]|nr:hypothetical protein F5Y08DRAFT_298594 [Xylaria arbuscula]